jgi:predicted nuclease of restriction endonuclease-like (RecB) superfamily
MAKSELVLDAYKPFLADIKARVRSAQYFALKAVNQGLIGLYWDIGQLIAARQASLGWGRSVVEQLAADLRAEFRGIGGFSASNLWRMKAFFEAYGDHEKLAPLVREIGWSHNLLILERCKNPLEREFYLRMTGKFGWSKNVLIHQIENQSYEKSLLGQTNFEHTLTPALRGQAALAVKDEYVFDFLELGQAHSERELENALIAKVEAFLRAMGGMFAFMGSQFRLEIDGREYFIDMLLFHRRLRCLVAIELKVGEFQPEFVGKLQFYLAALDDQVRQDDESPSIGIILCKEKVELLSNTLYATPENRLVLRPTTSRRNYQNPFKVNCLRQRTLRGCWSRCNKRLERRLIDAAIKPTPSQAITLAQPNPRMRTHAAGVAGDHLIAFAQAV